MDKYTGFHSFSQGSEKDLEQASYSTVQNADGFIETEGKKERTVQDLYKKYKSKPKSRRPWIREDLNTEDDKIVCFTESAWSKIFKKHEEVASQSFREHGGTLIGKIEDNRIVVTDIVPEQKIVSGSVFEYGGSLHEASKNCKMMNEEEGKIIPLGPYHFHPPDFGGIISNTADDIGLSLKFPEYSKLGKNHINVVFNTFDKEVSALSFNENDLLNISEETAKEMKDDAYNNLSEKGLEDIKKEKLWDNAMKKAFLRMIKVIPDKEA